MIWNILQPIIGPIVEKLVDRIPNPNERAKAKEQFESDLMNAVMDASTQQNKINAIEAAHKSVFVAGWRPFIGWICGIGLCWAFVLQPMAAWIFAAFLPDFPHPPQIQTDGLYQLVLAMLGMGGLRTFEKLRGVSRETSPGKSK
ncbi:MAG: hypothetical protein KDF59_06365 [Nitrosomonas sp.]|nr:hypothetical protein [Nitrosomonas sp.]